MDRRDERAREIQAAIESILLRDWDPIGVRSEPYAQDEYRGYVGRVYRLLASGESDSAIVDALNGIEIDEMGLSSSDRSHLGDVVRKLRSVDLSLH